MRPIFRLIFPVILMVMTACNSESGQTDSAQEEISEATSYQHVDSSGVLKVDYAKKAELEAEAEARTAEAEKNEKSASVEAIPLKPEKKSGTTAFQEYVGMGNEPNWNLQIKPAGIIWFLMGQKRDTFPYRKPKDRGETIVFTSRLDSEEKDIQVRITKAACSDTMSDEVFPFKCEVKYRGSDFTGCAK